MMLSRHVYGPIIDYLRDKNLNYLEIGVFNGVGLARVANKVPHVHCEAIDPFIEDGHTVGASNVTVGSYLSVEHQNTLKNIEGLNNVNLNVVTSHQYNDSLTPEKIQALNIGAVLIDGNHHYEYVVNDYQLAMRMIDNKSGIIVFDDIVVGGVLRAYNEFKDTYSDRIESTSSIQDMSVIVYIKEVK